MKRPDKADWLLRHRSLLTRWELDFVATLAARFQMGDGISSRQARILDQVYLKASLMVPPEQRAAVVSLSERRAASERTPK